MRLCHAYFLCLSESIRKRLQHETVLSDSLKSLFEALAELAELRRLLAEGLQRLCWGEVATRLLERSPGTMVSAVVLPRVSWLTEGRHNLHS